MLNNRRDCSITFYHIFFHSTDTGMIVPDDARDRQKGQRAAETYTRKWLSQMYVLERAEHNLSVKWYTPVLKGKAPELGCTNCRVTGPPGGFIHDNYWQH